MRDTRHLLRAPAYLALFALGATAACSGEAEQAPQEQGQESTEADSPGPDLSGMVFFHDADHELFLTFHDPEDGSLDTRVGLQNFSLQAAEDDGGYYPRKSGDFSFAPGFGHTVTPTQQGLLLGVLDDQGQAYEPGSTLAPEEGASFNDGEITYESPQFSPDGTQLWFEERTEHGEEDSRILAVDLDDPEAEPEEVGSAPNPSFSAGQVEEEQANQSTTRMSAPSSAYTITENNELTVYSNTEEENDAGLEFLADSDSGDVMPWNFVRGSEGLYIGPLDGSAQENQYTALSVFALDADGTVSDEELLVEAEGNPILRHWYDSDSDRALLKTDDGYYWQEMDSEAEPELAFTAPDFGDDDDITNDKRPVGLYSPQS
ncbi:hypothetical protein [Nocardiopsis xinjiangensis]|uniref:hypothetical protein n=1 Tax=Nocardiopsis xinjiangensis TaxID=124285 RepID=UPI0003491225|nr:hypothetical protein [Nocardiopsis xinjiangensis]